MEFSNTKLSVKRPLTTYAKVQSLIGAIIRNRLFQVNRTTVRAKSYLNIGCGRYSHPDFVNLDYWWHPRIDICWDISRGLPLPDESMEGIFSEHCIEHIPLDTVDFVLSECMRILKPRGSIRITVPDGELYLKGYVHRIAGDTSVKLPYAEADSYAGLYSPIMSVNRIFREHGHLFIYDFDVLKKLLQKNGFINICKESYAPGRDKKLLIDQESRAIETLYVEGTKPQH